LFCFKRELEVVLKSFEYHTVQSTINTLHSTKPIPLEASPQDQEYPSHYIPTAHTGHKNVGGQDRIRTEGAFIPVSAASRGGINKQQPNNGDMRDAQLEVIRQQTEWGEYKLN
jgi:hypothetical protein